MPPWGSFASFTYCPFFLLHISWLVLPYSQYPLPEILPSYWSFRFLLNQSGWHIFTVYKKLAPQHACSSCEDGTCACDRLQSDFKGRNPVVWQCVWNWRSCSEQRKQKRQILYHSPVGFSKLSSQSRRVANQGWGGRVKRWLPKGVNSQAEGAGFSYCPA